MNKKTKLLLVLLSSTALTAGAFGLAACSGEAHNEEYYAQYQQYVEATADGEALSYEEWLIGILEDAKGEKGDKGDKGEDGKDGAVWLVAEGEPAATTGSDGDFYLNKTTFDVYTKTSGTWTKVGNIKGADGAAGAAGAGIESITYKDGALEVALTSGTKLTVTLPEELTHEHTYGSELTTLIEPTVEKEGLAYKVCTGKVDGKDCGHIELVVLPKLQYDITVIYEGAPLANVEVTVSGTGIAEEGSVKATTDENGKISVSPDKAGEYTITVAGYTVIKGGKTSATETVYSIEVAKTLVSEETIGAGTYAVLMNPNYYDDPKFELSSDDAVKYTLSVEGKAILNSAIWNDNWEDWDYSEVDLNNDGKYETVVVSGAPETYSLSVDWEAIGDDYAAYTVILTVEESEAPAEGDKLRPITATLGEDVTINGTGEWQYCTLTVNDTQENITHVTFTYEGTATVEFTQKRWGMDVGEYAYSVTSGTAFALTTDGNASYGTTAYKFRVKTSEQITISTEQTIPVGAAENPAVAQKGENTVENLGMGKYYYYKLEVPANGDYIIDVAEGSVRVFAGSATGSYVAAADEGSIIGLNPAEATTYYLEVSTYTSSNAVFTVRDYNAQTDAGLISTHPIVISEWETTDGNSTYTYTNADLASSATVYFKMTAPVAGRFVIVSNDEDVTYSCIQSGNIYEEAGKEVIVQVMSYDANEGYDFKLEWHELSATTTYNVQLKDTDGAAIVGAIITATQTNAEEPIVVTSTATDAEGKTTMVLNPMYNYTFTVEYAEADANKYQADFSWSFNSYSGAYDFGGDLVIDTVKKVVAHTVTVYAPDGTTPMKGLTVRLRLGGATGTIAGEATTDEDGVAVVYAVALDETSAYSKYYIEVVYSAENPNYSAGDASLPTGTTATTIVTSVVNVVGDDMKLLVGINKVTVADPYSGTTEFTFTAEEAGEYKITISNVQANFWTYWYVNDEAVNRYMSMNYTISATAGQEISIGLASVSGAYLTIEKV